MTSEPSIPFPPPPAPAADRTVDKPLLIFDGDCNFCRRSVRWITKITGDRADYAPSQEVGADFPSIRPEEFGREVKVVATDGQVYGAAESVFQLLCAAGRGWWTGLPLRAYRTVPGFRWASETAYRFVAAHRAVFSRLTRWL